MPMTVEEFAELYPNVRDVVLAERFSVSKDVIYRTGKALRDAGIIKGKKRGRPSTELPKSPTSDIEQKLVKTTKKTLKEIEKMLRPGCQTKQLTLGKVTNEKLKEILKDEFLEDVIRAIVQVEIQNLEICK